MVWDRFDDWFDASLLPGADTRRRLRLKRHYLMETLKQAGVPIPYGITDD